MAFPATDVLHVYVTGVAVGNTQGKGPLGRVFRMTVHTYLPRSFTAVILIHSRCISGNKSDQHPVFLDDIEFVTILTYDLGVLAVGPRSVSVLHQMAERAKIGVRFRIGVITFSDDDSENADHKSKYDDA